jgi:hypothetical protein
VPRLGVLYDLRSAYCLSISFASDPRLWAEEICENIRGLLYEFQGNPKGMNGGRKGFGAPNRLMPRSFQLDTKNLQFVSLYP